VVQLEHQFQCELQVSRVTRSSCLPKGGIVDCVVPDLEVGVVQNIEGFGAELKLPRLGKLEFLEYKHISCPISGSKKGILPEVPNTRQARSSEEIRRKIKSVGPLSARCINMIRLRVRSYRSLPRPGCSHRRRFRILSDQMFRLCRLPERVH
jgi:hypothetical protein